MSSVFLFCLSRGFSFHAVSSSLGLLHWLANCSFCLLFCSVYLADLFRLWLVVERTRGLYFTFSTVTSFDYSMPPAVKKWFSFTTSAYDDYCFLTGYACQTLHLQHFFTAAGWECSSVDRAESLTVQKFVLNMYIAVKVNYILVIFVQHILFAVSFTGII